MAKKKEMKQIAVLDKFDVLVGWERVSEVKEGDVVVPVGCTLDTNEKYRYDWTLKTFVPRGTMVGKAKPQDVTEETAIYLLMDALIEGKPIPSAVKKYRNWYRDNIKKHEDEVNSWRKKQ